MEIRQAEVSPCGTKRELLVIEPQKMEYGRVEIVHVDRLFRCGESKFVGCAMDVSTFHPSPSQPHGEPVIVVITPILLPCIGPRCR